MALLIEHVRRLHRNETRFPVREAPPGRLEHGCTGAAAANPPFEMVPSGRDHRLCASLGRGRRHRAHDGRERKRLARRFACRDDAENIGELDPSDSYPREIWLEGRKAFEIMGWSKQIDIRQRRLHAARLRAVVAPADQRIEPDDAPAATTQAPHFLA